jgi:chromosome segregation ATPase
MSMENTDADQQPTPEQAEIIERLRLMQAEVDAVKTDLVAKLHESREQVDSLFRELSKVRDELITSKTERRVLSRWYENAKAERDKLRSEVEMARSSAASLERIQATAARWGASGQEDAGHFIERTATDLEFVRLAKDELQNKLAETTKDLAYSRLAVDTMSAQDKRVTETIAKSGAADGEDIGDFIERTCAERDKLHGELVEVRSALADVSAERDSLRTTLASWEAADTTPFLKVPDVADHVMPPVLPLCMTCHECGRVLVSCSQGTTHYDCPSNNCPRTCTVRPGGFSPYSGPCKSETPVRHE